VSPAQRIAILAVAAVVLVGGFFLAQGSDDDEDSKQAGATQSAQTATDVETAPNEPENPAATAPQTTEKPAPRVESIRIRDRRPVGDPATLEYESGETVRLRFTSNVAVEIHIHGYDKYVNVPAGSSATTRFKADAEGIFELEEHETGNLVAKLEVRP